MGSSGLSNCGYIDFSLYKPWGYAQHCGDILTIKALPKAPLKSWQVNAKLSWQSNPCCSMAPHEQMAVKPPYAPLILGPMGARVFQRLVGYHIGWVTIEDDLSLVVRKPVFGVSDQVPHKPGCTTTEDG